MHYIPLILVIVAGLILTAGNIILKEWVIKSYHTFYFAGLFLYFISMNLLAFSYKYEDIAVASMAMVIFNIITLTLVGYFFFHENITVYEISGIFLGIIAIVLLEFGKI
jgi:multidrug transporter EmrE-like cation transporter